MPMQLTKSRLRADIDNRELCFSQGKPCIYLSETDNDILVTEWPNGVTEHKSRREKTVIRTWPDGRIERFAAGSAADGQFPHME